MNKIIIKDLEFSTNADLCLEAKGFIQVFIIKVNFGQDTKKPVFTVYVDEKHYLSYDTLESAINHCNQCDKATFNHWLRNNLIQEME